jgi:hypothetical protein
MEIALSIIIAIGLVLLAPVWLAIGFAMAILTILFLPVLVLVAIV